MDIYIYISYGDFKFTICSHSGRAGLWVKNVTTLNPFNSITGFESIKLGVRVDIIILLKY